MHSLKSFHRNGGAKQIADLMRNPGLHLNSAEREALELLEMADTKYLPDPEDLMKAIAILHKESPGLWGMISRIIENGGDIYSLSSIINIKHIDSIMDIFNAV
jgi:hypothetical protein